MQKLFCDACGCQGLFLLKRAFGPGAGGVGFRCGIGNEADEVRADRTNTDLAFEFKELLAFRRWKPRDTLSAGVFPPQVSVSFLTEGSILNASCSLPATMIFSRPTARKEIR